MNWYKHSQFDYEANLSDLLKKMAKLDQALTGKDWRTVTQQAYSYKDKFSDPEYMFGFAYGGDVYYLSDGGYSRVGVSDESGKLFPTSNSLDKVKNNWNAPAAQSIIKDVEQDIAKIRERFDNDPDYTEVIKLLKGE